MKAPFVRAAAALLVLGAAAVAPGCGGSQPPEPEPLVSSKPDVPEEPVVRDETPTLPAPAPTLAPIHFDFNEYRINGSARNTLQDVSVIMKDHPDWSLVLEGHCDERGTEQYNFALGENRAQAAKRYLESLGVEPGRFQTISYGEERPADPGHDEVAWAKNRRAELRLRVPGS